MVGGFAPPSADQAKCDGGEEQAQIDSGDIFFRLPALSEGVGEDHQQQSDLNREPNHPLLVA